MCDADWMLRTGYVVLHPNFYKDASGGVLPEICEDASAVLQFAIQHARHSCWPSTPGAASCIGLTY